MQLQTNIPERAKIRFPLTSQPAKPSCQNQEKEIPFEMQLIRSWDRYNAHSPDLPHRHQHVEVIWIKRGNGYLDIDRRRYEMGNNTLYYIIPGQLHHLEMEDAEGYILSFPEELLHSGSDDFELMYRTGLFHMLNHSPAINVRQDVADEIEDISGKLYREMINGHVLRSEIIKRYTCIFLIYLARQLEVSLPVATQSNDICLAKKFIALVENKYINWKMVKEYARELAVSPNYLNEVVKRMSGYSARHHIQQRILLEAKRQATCEAISMKEIAYQLGFDDMAHFSKYFKTVYGKNFTDFRKELFC